MKGDGDGGGGGGDEEDEGDVKAEDEGPRERRATRIPALMVTLV